MALISLPASPEKGTEQQYSLSTTELFALVSDSYFTNQNNLRVIELIYQSSESNQIELISFIPNGDPTLLSMSEFSLEARDLFGVQSIVLVDKQNGRYVISRSEIPSVASYDVSFSAGPTPSQYVLYDNYPLSANVTPEGGVSGTGIVYEGTPLTGDFDFSFFFNDPIGGEDSFFGFNTQPGGAGFWTGFRYYTGSVQTYYNDFPQLYLFDNFGGATYRLQRVSGVLKFYLNETQIDQTTYTDTVYITVRTYDGFNLAQTLINSAEPFTGITFTKQVFNSEFSRVELEWVAANDNAPVVWDVDYSIDNGQSYTTYGTLSSGTRSLDLTPPVGAEFMKVRIRYYDGSSYTPYVYTENISLASAPAPTVSISIPSGTYASNEEIGVSVTFNEPVTIPQNTVLFISTSEGIYSATFTSFDSSLGPNTVSNATMVFSTFGSSSSISGVTATGFSNPVTNGSGVAIEPFSFEFPDVNTYPF
jgi:hypothetical protein